LCVKESYPGLASVSAEQAFDHNPPAGAEKKNKKKKKKKKKKQKKKKKKKKLSPQLDPTGLNVCEFFPPISAPFGYPQTRIEHFFACPVQEK
jgi:hypothetical protein